MASSSYCFVLVSLIVVLQILLTSASTQYIDAICQKVTDKAFCTKTLTGNPAAASATNTFQVGLAALRIGISYADKSAGVSAKAAVENPNLKMQFNGCKDAFSKIVANLKSASSELKRSPEAADYDVMLCTDETKKVNSLVGKLSDKASKNIMMMELMMQRYIAIALGVTGTVLV